MIALATPETAAYVAANLGPDEVVLQDYAPEDAAMLAYETARDSILSWVVFAPDGEPVALFGADGDPGETWGSAWMFSTAHVGKARRIELVRGIKTAVTFSRTLWPALRVNAEDRSPKQTRFLELAGFHPSTDDPKELHA